MLGISFSLFGEGMPGLDNVYCKEKPEIAEFAHFSNMDKNCTQYKL